MIFQTGTLAQRSVIPLTGAFAIRHLHFWGHVPMNSKESCSRSRWTHVMTTSDLHVVSLHYSIRSSEQVAYVNQPPTVEFETGDARFHLAAGKLTCTMKTHFSKVDDAFSAQRHCAEEHAKTAYQSHG